MSLNSISAPFHVQFPAPHEQLTGGRLSHFHEDWSRISGTWHDRILCQGILLEFLNGQPPAENRPFDSTRDLIGQPASSKHPGRTLKYYLEIGAVVRISDNQVSGVWSTFFPVPKKNTTKVWGCIDLRPLNCHLVYRHFKMEGAHTFS